jgi:hypothetical protein
MPETSVVSSCRKIIKYKDDYTFINDHTGSLPITKIMRSVFKKDHIIKTPYGPMKCYECELESRSFNYSEGITSSLTTVYWCNSTSIGTLEIHKTRSDSSKDIWTLEIFDDVSYPEFSKFFEKLISLQK